MDKNIYQVFINKDFSVLTIHPNFLSKALVSFLNLVWNCRNSIHYRHLAASNIVETTKWPRNYNFESNYLLITASSISINQSSQFKQGSYSKNENLVFLIIKCNNNTNVKSNQQGKKVYYVFWSICLPAHNPWNTSTKSNSHFGSPLYIVLSFLSISALNIPILILNLINISIMGCQRYK